MLKDHDIIESPIYDDDNDDDINYTETGLFKLMRCLLTEIQNTIYIK